MSSSDPHGFLQSSSYHKLPVSVGCLGSGIGEIVLLTGRSLELGLILPTSQVARGSVGMCCFGKMRAVWNLVLVTYTRGFHLISAHFISVRINL